MLYNSRDDYIAFIELLMESITLCGVNIGAYCLMPNHYHLLVQTPEANLDRCMRHINGVYTQRFNRKYKRDGQLFRGRYKSLLVEENNYLLHLVRYIHRNPLRAGLTHSIDQYQWSSHKGYLSNSNKWNWLSKDFLLSFLSDDKTTLRREYKKFILQEDSEEIVRIFNSKKLVSILGTEKFRKWVKEKFFSLALKREIPEGKVLAIDIEKIKTAVAESFRVEKSSLMGLKRKIRNDPRDVAIYLTRKNRRDTLEEIGKGFGISKYSTVSTILLNIKERISKDRALKKKFEHVEKSLYNDSVDKNL